MIHTTIVKCLQESIAFEGYLNSYSTYTKFRVEDGIYVNNLKYRKKPVIYKNLWVGLIIFR